MAATVRKCFYCFHYQPDNWRVSTVRQIGAIEGSPVASDNEWEAITSGNDKDQKIASWITRQMAGRSCLIALVGAETANRKWINYEIEKAWKDGLGVVGIRIHGLLDREQRVSNAGANPFDYVRHPGNGRPLSAFVKLYNPAGDNSKDRYGWIATHLGNAVEEAISIRKAN
jgi:hypothetical protein